MWHSSEKVSARQKSGESSGQNYLFKDLVTHKNGHACVLSHFSCILLFVAPGTAAHQAPLSMGFSRQEYWSGSPCPPPGDIPDLGIEPMTPASTSLAGRFFTTEPPRSPKEWACIRTNPRATQTLAERSLWETWPLSEHKHESRTALGPSVSYASCRRKPETCIFMTTNEYWLQMRPQNRQAMVRG